MLRRQSLIALGVALVLGLVAVYLANIFLNVRASQLNSSPAGTTKVAVAAVPLNYGTPVTADKIKFVDYPTTSLPSGTYTSIPALLPQGKQRVALRPILVNQPLLSADLTGEGQNASIAALLPDGMRATSVRVNDVSGVAGFVKPNDTVDVLITRQPIGGNGTGQQVTDVLLQNVRVIAMDQNAKDQDGSPAVSRTATLEVSPVDAQKLTLGQQLGSLSLVLRKPGIEQNIPGVETVSLADLRYGVYGGPRPTVRLAQSAAPVRRQLSAPRRARPQPKRPAPPAIAAAAKPAGQHIEITRGTQSSTYEVGGYAR
jgi:pilus assembly protein CpaB